MISYDSMIVFISLNTTLLGTSWLQYTLFSNALYLFAFIFLRNLVMCKGLEYATEHKPITNADYKKPEEEFIYYIAQGSLIETLSVYVINPTNMNPDWLTVSVFFIPMSFAFEVIYDFFFYWGHRYLHVTHSPLHKLHHEYIHLKPAITFYQDTLDMLLTVTVPFLLTERIIQSVYPLSSFEISALLVYKTFIEISGHTGHDSYPSPSFTLFIWLPKVLKIESYSEDHALHHTDVTCNYSKRFILFDKIFGTYKIK